MDHLGDVADQDPTPTLMELASSTAYQYDDASLALLVLRAADVSELLRDRRLWSRRPADPRLESLDPESRAAFEEAYGFFLLWPVFSEGDQHDDVRAELVEGLAGTVTKETREQLGAYVGKLLDGTVGAPMDWIEDFARPYVGYVVSTILGVSLEEAEVPARLGDIMMHMVASPHVDMDRARAALGAIDELHRWLNRLLQGERTRLVAALARIWESPELGPRSATAALAQVVTGTVDPVMSTLGVVAERVDADHLRQLPVPVLREEVLRLATPFRYAVRFARCPLDLDGHRVAEGDRVVLGLVTANLDPHALDDPLTIRQRTSADQFAFGAGAHYCPGAGVARAAIDAVLGYLRDREVSFHPHKVKRAPELPLLRYRQFEGMLS